VVVVVVVVVVEVVVVVVPFTKHVCYSLRFQYKVRVLNLRHVFT